MSPEKVFAAAVLAAEALSMADWPKYQGHNIFLGCLLVEEVRQLAAIASVPVKVEAYAGNLHGGRAYVIESASCVHHGVEIRWQGSRSATAEDLKRGAYSLPPGRNISPEEALALVGQ